jgi:hypothetical protein
VLFPVQGKLWVERRLEMDESMLWIVAFGTGALGLLLLVVAGAVAIVLKTVARSPRRVPPVEEPRSRATGKQPPPISETEAPPVVSAGPWLWIKAWIFAVFHASIVSLVLGGITFFEDLAKASEEIQSTGRVTFPKQLLPGPLSGSVSQKRLTQSPGDAAQTESDEVKKLDGPDAAEPRVPGWEVVNLVSDVGAERG